MKGGTTLKLEFCVACGNTAPDELEHHHLVPLGAGGEDKDSNLITLCSTCHGAIHGMLRQPIATLTKTALQHKRKNGERVGSIPYGYQMAMDNVRLVEDQSEQEVIRAVIEFDAAGLSLRAISTRLKQLGYLARGGGVFHPQTVSNILAARQAA
jgi:hypothetical protein